MRAIAIKLYSLYLRVVSRGLLHGNFVPFLEFNGFPSRVGDGCFFQRNSWFNVSKGGFLTIGDYCYFGHGCQINAFQKVEIGNSVLISDNVFISDADHAYKNILTPIKDQEIVTSPVFVGDGTWIGRNAVILPGVKIGQNCVVGANAVVNKNIPDFCVVAGVPAVPIKFLGTRSID